MAVERHLHCGALLHFVNDPQTHKEAACEYIENGALLVEGGRVARIAPARQLRRDFPDVPLTEHGEALLTPGFVDTHIHYPQTDIIASYGESLLDWLRDHAFPAEEKFADSAHCAAVAERFLDSILSHGTTSALVFATVHPQSAECLFAAAQARQLRLIGGKVLMDINAPPELADTPGRAYDESRALIEKWHNRDRLRYAVTPRFALTCSAEQLAAAGRLLREYPDVLLHTHLAENTAELQQVGAAHPDAQHYTGVYHRHGLVCERSVFAHSIHLCDEEWRLLADRQARISFCPTSNFMLGSGLFDAARARRAGIALSLGSDVGGGSSFSLFKVMEEAYKCARLRGDFIRPTTLWYWATLGGARALHLDAHIGNFASGKEADFLVLKPAAIPTLQRRWHQVDSIEEKLLLAAVLGDERLVDSVYIMGEKVNLNR